MDRQAILKKLEQPEEKLLAAKAMDQADFSLRHFALAFTDFMDPKMSGILEEEFRRVPDLNIVAFGGAADCERRMFAFSPDYMEIRHEDFPLKAVKIQTNLKFAEKLSHRDYLGSILGLGIDRGKMGDIFLYDDFTAAFVREEIADYIALNLTKVSRTKVTCEVTSPGDITLPAKEIQETRQTVSSLRLDCILGAAFKLSRGKAKEYIEGEKVNVNWRSINHTSFVIKEGDMISVRGLGRIRVMEIGGRTKKDRIAVTLGKYV